MLVREWSLSSLNLQLVENAKVILASAVQELPQSVRIWMRAVELEQDAKSKKRVLRKGAGFHPYLPCVQAS